MIFVMEVPIGALQPPSPPPKLNGSHIFKKDVFFGRYCNNSVKIPTDKI